MRVGAGSGRGWRGRSGSWNWHLSWEKTPAVWGHGHTGSGAREGVDLPVQSGDFTHFPFSVLSLYSYVQTLESIFNGDRRLCLDFGGRDRLGVVLFLGKPVPLLSALSSFFMHPVDSLVPASWGLFGGLGYTASPSSPGLDPGILSRLSPGRLNICSSTSKMLSLSYSHWILSILSVCTSFIPFLLFWCGFRRKQS